MITITLMIIAFSFLFPAMLGSGSQAGTITPKPITANISIHSILLRGIPSPAGAGVVP
jgi:hypothetical protein